MTSEEMINQLKTCDFVLSDFPHFAVAIKDIPEGFIVVAKAAEKESIEMTKTASELMKLVVETPNPTKEIFDKIEIDVPFSKYNATLIDIMEEFRLIEIGSKK